MMPASRKSPLDARETRLRRQALQIFRAALRAADPEQAILRHLAVDDRGLRAGTRRYYWRDFDRIFVAGAGKASATMGRALERLLGKRIAGGLINVKYGHTAKLRRIALQECAHPVPDANGVAGARKIAALAQELTARDLLICAISGGASALLPLPAEPITLEEKQATTQALLRAGANIHELNAVRKHISAIKGGQLARLASPATVLTVLLSDVIGDDLDVIGSGPTAPDRSTYEQACRILDKYALWQAVPAAVRERLAQGRAGALPETPKPDDPTFERVQNLVVGSSRLAVAAAVAEAKQLGFRTLVLSTRVEGEAREVARVHAAILREVRESGQPLRPPACLISGGETTVTLRGEGLGGRNQEFALAAAMDLKEVSRVVLLSAGTDGTDGPTDAAGAIATGTTLPRAVSLGVDAQHHLAANDSYHFFARLGDLIKTGPTNTNVMDLCIMLAD